MRVEGEGQENEGQWAKPRHEKHFPQSCLLRLLRLLSLLRPLHLLFPLRLLRLLRLLRPLCPLRLLRPLRPLHLLRLLNRGSSSPAGGKREHQTASCTPSPRWPSVFHVVQGC